MFSPTEMKIWVMISSGRASDLVMVALCTQRSGERKSSQAVGFRRSMSCVQYLRQAWLQPIFHSYDNKWHLRRYSEHDCL